MTRILIAAALLLGLAACSDSATDGAMAGCAGPARPTAGDIADCAVNRQIKREMRERDESYTGSTHGGAGR